MRRWRRIAHRGAPFEFPENTLRSLERALELGCDMVEFDVRQAVDGVPVLAHDPVVCDRSGCAFVVARTTAAALHALDLGAGEGVPTLAEVVTWAHGRCDIMPDMKVGGGDIEARVVEILAAMPLQAIVIGGADRESRGRFRSLNPDLRLSHTQGNGFHRLFARETFATRLETLDTHAATWEYPLLDAERVAAFHARGLAVYAWTVDELDVMQRMLAIGIDGLITNRPELFAELPCERE